MEASLTTGVIYSSWTTIQLNRHSLPSSFGLQHSPSRISAFLPFVHSSIRPHPLSFDQPFHSFILLYLFTFFSLSSPSLNLMSSVLLYPSNSFWPFYLFRFFLTFFSGFDFFFFLDRIWAFGLVSSRSPHFHSFYSILSANSSIRLLLFMFQEYIIFPLDVMWDKSGKFRHVGIVSKTIFRPE